MKKNKQWYSVILALLMVGFMVVLTSWVFLLILWENRDTKTMEYSLKAFAGAEGAIELALYQAKTYNYSYSETLKKWDALSQVLYKNTSNFLFGKDVDISYELVSTATGIVKSELKQGEFSIIPLFTYTKDGSEKKAKNIKVSWLTPDVVWNIVGENSGIAWVNDFWNSNFWDKKTLTSGTVEYGKEKVETFLFQSNKNYLILHNTSWSDVTYSVTSLNPWELITKDTTFIVGTWDAWGYKQNLRVNIQSGEYLNLLKYSIFSN